MPKNENVNAELLYVYLNQWNESIKKGLVVWLLRSHEHILLWLLFSTVIPQLSEDEETDSGEKESTSVNIIKESSSLFV